MRAARCFVQHSVEASNGDCEGTPVGILEASASGLPIVSTRHGGIPDAVLEGKTGFLVAERDVLGMTKHMTDIVRSPQLAAQLGRNGRRHIQENFAMMHSLDRLWAIIDAAIARSKAPELLSR